MATFVADSNWFWPNWFRCWRWLAMAAARPAAVAAVCWWAPTAFGQLAPSNPPTQEQVDRAAEAAAPTDPPTSPGPGAPTIPADSAPDELATGETISGEPVPPGEVAGGPEDEIRTYRPITELTVDAALPDGLLPSQVHREDESEVPPVVIPEIVDMRLACGWAESDFNWSATQLCHGPLYFEQVNLERHGYGPHPLIRPFTSGAHFFLTVPTLPYQMVVHPPRECIYTLGYYRPGNRVPYRWKRPPWDSRAAAVEAATVVGLVFLIP